MVITNVNQVVYRGDGVTTAFPFTFRIIDATDIKLLLIDADGTETDIQSDYFVDTVNNTVHYPGYAPGAEHPEADQPAPVQTGQKLVIYRELPITQEKDLGDKWPFFVIELALDKLTMILQQIYGWWGRTLKFGVGWQVDHPDFDATIPVEAGKTWRVNDEGTGFVATGDPDEAVVVANNAKDVADAAALVAAGAKTTAEGIAATAQDAKDIAQDAKTVADDAKDVAAEAKTTAEGIAATAQDAKDIAQDAKTVADDAKDVAAEAKTTASGNLALTGGTMSGTIKWSGKNLNVIKRDNGNDGLCIIGGDKDNFSGATLQLFGQTNSSYAGRFYLRASTRSDVYDTSHPSSELTGYPDGTLTWNSQPLLPVGIVQAFAGKTIPSGWLLCDGSAVSRTNYAKLYAVIGTTYGTGNGSTTFNLPNLVDKFVEGSATAGTQRNAGLPNIKGSITKIMYYSESSATGAFRKSNSSNVRQGDGSSLPSTYDYDFDASRSNSIYGKSATVQPPALTMRYIIKY